ncbi:unnamed protein product [Nippostrongylus brasiliensis]|uniref:Pecanex-like protein n=1 Tax=Nippostrongylus brasiliensis TaxID=27835 RepID=A0A0N4XZX6_NIPBR|nr:unnamed protein product [Nippostrongylus brasiliensis]
MDFGRSALKIQDVVDAINLFLQILLALYCRHTLRRFIKAGNDNACLLFLNSLGDPAVNFSFEHGNVMFDEWVLVDFIGFLQDFLSRWTRELAVDPGSSPQRCIV